MKKLGKLKWRKLKKKQLGSLCLALMLGALISVPAMTSQNIVSDGDTREASLVSVEVIPNDELESTLPADVQRMLGNSQSEIITRGGDAPSGDSL